METEISAILFSSAAVAVAPNLLVALACWLLRRRLGVLADDTGE